MNQFTDQAKNFLSSEKNAIWVSLKERYYAGAWCNGRRYALGTSSGYVREKGHKRTGSFNKRYHLQLSPSFPLMAEDTKFCRLIHIFNMGAKKRLSQEYLTSSEPEPLYMLRFSNDDHSCNENTLKPFYAELTGDYKGFRELGNDHYRLFWQ